MDPVRVVVVDDSPICRLQLRNFLQSENDITVVAEGASGKNALELVQHYSPHLLILDLQMPEVSGLEAISHVMANAPLPILVVTSQPVGEGSEFVFEAIRRGALALAEKPSGTDARAQQELRQAVKHLSSLPVVRHVAGKLAVRPPVVPPPSILPPPRTGSSAPLVVGVGSSAGGPVALATFIAQFPATTQAAFLVVQHLPHTFIAAFAEFLTARSALPVVQVTRTEPVRPGCVYLSAREAHIRMESVDRVGLTTEAPRNGHRPSVDVLLESMAQHTKARSCGVILSGMGDDGSRGLLSLRRGGGLCLAQDKESSAVWGMPKVAMEIGAAEQALPPVALAAVVQKWALGQG